MNNNRFKLVLVIVLMALTGWGIFRLSDVLSQKPWVRTEPLEGLSGVASDISSANAGGDSGHILLIGDSKRSLIKSTVDGQVIFKRTVEPKDGEGLMHYDGVAADDSGYVYALLTLLDSNGLYVTGEQIQKISPDGSSAQVVAEYHYDPVNAPRMMRVGKIKSMTVKDNRLYYYYADGSSMTLYSLAPDSFQSEPVFQKTLPQDQVLADVAGVNPEQRYYVTKKGRIYQLQANGDPQLVYPLPGMDRTARNIPGSLYIDEQGRIVFIDQKLNEISRLDLNMPYVIESVLSNKKLKAAGHGSLSTIEHVNGGSGGTIYVVTDSQIISLRQDGTIFNYLDTSTVPLSSLLVRYLAWALVVLEALLLLLLMRLLYIGPLNRKVPLILKFLLAFVPIVLSSMIILSNLVYDDLSEKLEAEIRQNLALLAANGKNAVNGDRLERLTSPEHYMNADYSQIRSSLNALYNKAKGAARDGLYIAVYKADSNGLFVMMDDDDNVMMYRPIQMDDEYRAALEGRIITGKTEDSNGSWLYAMGPIFNSAQQIVGVYETGKDFNAVKQHNQQMMVKIVWYMVGITLLILIVFLTIAFSVSHSVRRLRSSVNEISDGKWDASVDIRSNDELADLGERFNAMVTHIRNYILQITKFSEAYFRFVPQQFLNFIGKESIIHVKLGDQVQQDMAILVSNMRDFYRLSRKLTPKENFNFINSFLKRFGPVIRNHDGFVSSYLGAGLQALFPKDADQALRAAVEMRSTLHEYNQHRASVNYGPLDIGIALHKGPLMLGVIGEEKRMENSVISEHVNLVSRLEQMTEKLGVSILITEDFFLGLKNREAYAYRSLGLVYPSGEEQPLQLFDVFEGDPEHVRRLKEETRPLFEKAVHMYQNGRFYDAREAFLEVIRLNRWDQAARLYFYLCDEYFQNGAPVQWNGTLSVS